jgi:hypothetical protein
MPCRTDPPQHLGELHFCKTPRSVVSTTVSTHQAISSTLSTSFWRTQGGTIPRDPGSRTIHWPDFLHLGHSAERSINLRARATYLTPSLFNQCNRKMNWFPRVVATLGHISGWGMRHCDAPPHTTRQAGPHRAVGMVEGAGLVAQTRAWFR